MPQLKLQTRFLLRGSVLLAAFLIFWWLVLLNPLLYLLRTTASGLIPIAESATGDWTIQVPLETVVPVSPDHPTSMRVHSIDFDLAHADAGAFTFGLPVFWAVILATPNIRRSLRPLLFGTVAMAVLELILFLVYVETFAHKTAAQWSPSPDPVAAWFYRSCDYLLVSVIPYIAPFVLAIVIDRELRGQILGRDGALAPDAAAPALTKRKRARKRAF